MILEGIDISKWQTTTPSLSGREFAFVRATFGTAPDSAYAQHAANVRAAGKVLGAYAFGVGGDPIAQANAFLATAKDAHLLALDLERNTTGTSMTDAEASLFIATIHKAGRKIGLYHSLSGFPQALGQDWNWVAAWGSTAPSIPWAFWQYRGSPLDLDRFNGDLSALRRLAGIAPKHVVRVRPLVLWHRYAVSGTAARKVSRNPTVTGWHANCSVPRTAWENGARLSLVQVEKPGSKFDGWWVRADAWGITVKEVIS